MNDKIMKSLNGYTVHDAGAREAIEALKGSAPGLVFDTVADMEAYVAEHSAELKIGQDLYIRETDAPDYWWDGTQAVPVETDMTAIRKEVGELEKAIDDQIADILRRLGILESYHKQPIYNLPIFRLVGDTTNMTKEQEVVMTCELIDVFGEPIWADKVAEVKWQGSSSIWHDKKNYSIKLFESDGETKFKYKAFDDVDENNGYHIKANYIDAWHCRNIVSVNLAKDMYVKTLPSGARGCIDGFPITLEINGEKYGLYTWNLKQHKTVYGLDDDNANHIMYRANTNGTDVCNFRALSTDNSADNTTDWEDRFPETNTAENRAKLNRLISFIMSSDDETFKANLSQYLDLDYTIDYWILCYFGGFTDSLSKNMNIVTYDGNIWYPTFYDCDATWGITWNGQEQTPYNVQCPSEYQAPANLLWERLVANFPQRIYDRYFELRQNHLSVDSVAERLKSFIDSIPAEEYESDREIWTLPAATINSGIDYMTTWITKRAAFVDEKMTELVEINVALESIAINSALTITAGESTQLTVTYIPANATNKNVTWDSSNDSVATVDATGLVTAVGTGNCIITCTSEDGGFTAECALSVDAVSVTTDGIVYDFDFTRPANSNNKWESSVNAYTFTMNSYSADNQSENGYTLLTGKDAQINEPLNNDINLGENGMTLEAAYFGQWNSGNPIFKIGNSCTIDPKYVTMHVFDVDGNKLTGSDVPVYSVINEDSEIVPVSDAVGEEGFIHLVFRVYPNGLHEMFINGCKAVYAVSIDTFDHFAENLMTNIIRTRAPYADVTYQTYRAYNRPLTDAEIMNNYHAEKAK